MVHGGIWLRAVYFLFQRSKSREAPGHDCSDQTESRHHRMAQGFSDGGFADVDPFMRRLRQSVTPFEHDDITYGPEPRAVELMRRRSDFGFASGLSVPIYGPTGRAAAVFKGPTRTLLPHEKRAFHLITLYAFDRICRLCSPQPAQKRGFSQIVNEKCLHGPPQASLRGKWAKSSALAAEPSRNMPSRH